MGVFFFTFMKVKLYFQETKKNFHERKLTHVEKIMEVSRTYFRSFQHFHGFMGVQPLPWGETHSNLR